MKGRTAHFVKARYAITAAEYMHFSYPFIWLYREHFKNERKRSRNLFKKAELDCEHVNCSFYDSARRGW